MKKLKLDELNRKTIRQYKEADKNKITIVLDNIRSMHNIGSVFRSADSFLVEQIVLCGICAQPPHNEIRKTAIGAEETVPWIYQKETIDAVDQLKKDGYTVIGVEQVENSISLESIKNTLKKYSKIAIVLGNEVFGVQQEVLNRCDFCVEIPQSGTKHSLNISVATGIVLWELVRD